MIDDGRTFTRHSPFSSRLLAQEQADAIPFTRENRSAGLIGGPGQADCLFLRGDL